MGRGGIGLARDREPAGGDAAFCQGSALGVVRGELGQVEARAAELPRGSGFARLLLVADVRLLETLLRIGVLLHLGGLSIRRGLPDHREQSQADYGASGCPGN
jgi:hypothetical protein